MDPRAPPGFDLRTLQFVVKKCIIDLFVYIFEMLRLQIMQMAPELERLWKETVVVCTNVGDYPRICLEDLTKNV